MELRCRKPDYRFSENLRILPFLFYINGKSCTEPVFTNTKFTAYTMHSDFCIFLISIQYIFALINFKFVLLRA